MQRLFHLGFLLMVFILVILAVREKPGDRVENATADIAINDEAGRLISQCGPPTSDESTQYDNPRPPIVTRIIEYRQKKLRFIFIPGYDSRVGDPPPYRWKLSGITDMTGRDPPKARTVDTDEAIRRMGCWKAQ
jgi:hypothetical protein